MLNRTDAHHFDVAVHWWRASPESAAPTALAPDSPLIEAEESSGYPQELAIVVPRFALLRMRGI
jgi:hypothetical protein